MSAPALPRRSFLRGLASLPLIGGGVALIGQPTAAAVPVTEKMLDAYDEWLDLERSYLRWNRYGVDHALGPFIAPVECVFRDRRSGRVWDMHRATSFSGFDHNSPAPQTRAAVVLSAAGVPIGGDA